jgi:hypothetical protein
MRTMDETPSSCGWPQTAAKPAVVDSRARFWPNFEARYVARYPCALTPDAPSVNKGIETMAQKDMPAARERRMRRAAARRGLAVRKLDRGKNRGRFQLIDPEFGTPRSSPDRTYPTSFSLEEAETYIDQL